jgi:hypothetical protein
LASTAEGQQQHQQAAPDDLMALLPCPSLLLLLLP